MNGLVKIWTGAAIVLLFALSIFLRSASFSIDPIRDAKFTPFARWNNSEVWIHDKHVLDVYNTHPVNVHKFAAYIKVDPTGEFAVNKKDHSLIVYTSFPSVHFVVLFEALKLFGSLNFLGLQIFSLLIHFICVVLVFYLAWLLTRDPLLSVFGASIYTFSTNTLWNHMNVYWAHQLFAPVFLLALVVFVRQKGILRWWQGLLLGLAMSLITWTGVVAAAGFLLYGLYKFFKTKDRAYLTYLFMFGGVLLGLAFTMFQVLSATGINVSDYFGKVLHRAHARSVDSKTMPLPVLVWQFVNGLLLDYCGYLVIAYALAVKKKLRGFEWEVLFVASFPILESFILLEHDTIYSFGRLKWIIPIIVLICILGKKIRKRRILFVALAAAAILHSLIYLAIYT